MEISYECVGLSNTKPKRWDASVSILRFEDPCEFSVKARGSSFQVILGNYEHGIYICIPNYDVGCDLTDLTDSICNMNRLCSAGLSLVDAISVADAISAIDEWIAL